MTITMPQERITRKDIDDYKREVLEQSVLVTVDDAAAMMSCSSRKVYDLVRDGKISGYNATYKRRGLRLLASELREYVRAMKVDRERWRE